MKRIFPVAVLSALIAGCGSSGGGGGTLPPSASLDLVPTALQPAVQAAKTPTVDFLADAPLAQANTVGNFAGGTTFNAVTTVEIGSNSYTYGSPGPDFSALPVGLWDDTLKINYNVSDGGTTGVADGKIVAYNQPYSIVIGTTFSADTNSGNAKSLFKAPELDVFNLSSVHGRDTIAAEVATLNSNNVVATYTGVAYDHQQQGTLSYTMDFGTTRGYGKITGIARTGDITLQLSAPVGAVAALGGIQGVTGGAASTLVGSGTYQLGFFGPNAEEVAGFVSGLSDDKNVNFGGSR